MAPLIARTDDENVISVRPEIAGFTRAAAASDLEVDRSEPSETVTVREVQDFERLRAEWLNLADAVPHSSYFQTPDWISSWWETVADRPSTSIGMWRGTAGDLEAIAALSYVGQPLHPRGPLSVPSWINAGTGCGAADHCGWLALPHRGRAVQTWILGHARSATVLLQNLDPDIGLEPPSSARRVQRTLCPRLRVSLDDRQMGWSSNFRQQLRSRERKLRAAGVAIEWVDPPDLDESVLDDLFALHHDRWSRRKRRSSFTAEQKLLHRRLIQAAGPGRGPGAVVATHQGRRIGVLYGFWWKHVFAYYQMGWDTAYADYGLGTLLLREGIRMAATRHGQVFDFLRGTEPVKYRFNAEDRTDTTWLVPRGWPGALLGLSFAGRRLVRSIRDRWTPLPDMRRSHA